MNQPKTSFDFLATTGRRKFLFSALYLSEGAPIGFLWVALPTRLRSSGVAIDSITAFTALLILPWTMKFLWAPLIDLFHGRRWSLRLWVISMQAIMCLSLLPLLWLDLTADFSWITSCLLIHAFAAATQDVSIDALCIHVTNPTERGSYNGWMQAGVLVGRSIMGGGALILVQYLGQTMVVLLLLACTSFSMFLLLGSRMPDGMEGKDNALSHRFWEILDLVRQALLLRQTYIGVAFALFAGAAMKSLEVIEGPFLIDRNYAEAEIGLFFSVPVIGCKILGSLLGGWLADRFGHRLCVGGSLIVGVFLIMALACSDLIIGEQGGEHLFVLLGMIAFVVGIFTAASYAYYMDLTLKGLAATQFSGYMGAINGCEFWSGWLIGQIIAEANYFHGIMTMCSVSLLASLLLVIPYHGKKDPMFDEKLQG